MKKNMDRIEAEREKCVEEQERQAPVIVAPVSKPAEVHVVKVETVEKVAPPVKLQ